MSNPKAALVAELTGAEREQYEKFEALATAKVKSLRPQNPESPMVLDCRNALLGGGGREVLRCPSAEGWPQAGRTTADRTEAIGWATSHYLPHLWLALGNGRARNEPSKLTVAAACDRSIESLKVAGPNGTRLIPRALQSRVSNVSLHVKGRWGPLLLAAVQKSHMQERARRAHHRQSTAGSGIIKKAGQRLAQEARARSLSGSLEPLDCRPLTPD